MVKTNIQTFTGEVEILSNLHVGSYLTANGDASNVLDVTGNVGASFFVGDGGLISNIATTLSDIVDQGNLVANVVQFNAPPAVYAGVGIVTASNVGIQNANPLNTLSIADKVVIDKDVSEPSTTMNVHGKVYASRFEGDGGLLSNIATTLEAIINQGNVSANVVKFSSATDYAGAGMVTDSNVGIQNTAPVFNLSVGSNVHIDDEGSNVLTVHGNVSASNLNLGVFTVSASHGLDQVCAESNVVARPVRFSNVITAVSAVSNIESAGTFISTDAERGIDVASNIDIGGRLKFDSNVFIDTLRVADVAANIVTYDRTTGELLDSSGTFMNKFAVVSEQPPSDLFANATTVTNHGGYTLTTSNLATNSNTYNAFDGTANAWVSGDLAGGYIGGANVFHENNLTQLSNLHPTQFGDWLAIEFPYKTTLRHMKLTPLTAAQFPASANIYATNNDLTWTEVNYWSGRDPVTASNVQTITVNATEQFKKYALVATKAVGSSNVALQDWQLFTESFSIDGGKVAMAQQAATGGETVMDQHGPHGRGAVKLKKYPEIAFDASKLRGLHQSTNTYVQAGYTVSASSHENQILRSRGLTGDQGYFMNTAGPDFFNADGSYGIKGMQQRAHGKLTPRSRSAEIPSGQNPKSPVGALTPTGTRSYWADLGGDFFDEWGQWYIFNPADQTASHIQFSAVNGTNGTVYIDPQIHHGKTFIVKHGWVAQGIFKLDVECEDPTFSFSIGMHGNMGSDSTTENLDKQYAAPWGTLHYNFNRTNSGNAVSTDPFYTHLIPKQRSFNDATATSGTNFTSKLNTSAAGPGDELAIWFDTLQVGATMYFVLGASGNITTTSMVDWVANDITGEQSAWHVFDEITPESSWSSKSGTYYDGTSPANSYTGTTHQLGTGTAYGEWLKVKLSHRIKLTKFILYADDINEAPKSYKIYGSVTGSSWTELKDVSNETPSISGNSHEITDTEGYRYIAIVVTQVNTDQGNVRIGEIKLYGYENFEGGDTSVDTTFTSIMNTPQTTGAQVYVDGSLGETFTNRVVGPTVSNTHTTYVSAEKYWELSGNVESNVTLEANTFLSGDAPHSVSMWFNSSNLVSNASNSCIFSLGTEERLDHVSAAFSNNYQTVQKVLPSDLEANDRFGYAVDMNSDGTKFIVGAFVEHAGDNADAGAAYIFTYNSDTGNWDERKLVSPDIEAAAKFGVSVGMNSDGTKVIVGAFEEHAGGVDDAGAAYIFTYSNGSWDFGTKIVAPDKAASDKFGYSVAMSGDGTKVIVGAYTEDHNVAGGVELSAAGSAYIYTYTGSSWGTGTKIVASDRAASDIFGRSVAMNSDGTKAIVGADGGEAAYIFTYNSGTSNWDEQQILVASDAAAGDKFGYSVAMNSGGTKVIVGAYLNHAGSLSDAGAAYIYTYDGSSWDTGTKIVASDKEASARFGISVSMNSDGTKVIAGAYLDDANGTTDAGAAYVFAYDGSNWDTGLKIVSPQPAASDYFGYDSRGVAMSGDGARIVVGAQYADPISANAGSVYVYDRDTTHHLMTDLKLQSNTWHNLTYAYQGEGGSRVTYLDGRKVAEDQAEDTFGDYPPFGMTGYSQGGYCVSESSMYSSSYPGWKVFDDTVQTSWESTPQASPVPYATSSPGSGSSFGYATNANAAITTLGDSSTVPGEWIQMKFPHKISVNSVDIMPQTTLYTRMPGIAVFLGSNSGNDDWVTLATVSKEGATFAEAVYSSFIVNATMAYSYIRIIWKTLHTQSSAGLGRAGADEIKIYGHRENDLVRLPDPTNVLKYPHITMTGPAQRGYVASSSSENLPNYPAWEAFDDRYTDIDGGPGAVTRWQANSVSPTRYTDPGSGPWTPTTSYTDNITTLASGSSPASYTGDWLQLESPNKLNIKSYRLYNSTDYVTSYNAHTVVLLGSNTGNNDWVDIGSGEVVLSWSPAHDVGSYVSTVAIASTSGNTGFYKYHRLIVRKVTDQHIPVIYQVQLFGTEEATPVPIQIGGGNIDKVANFRVYDKFVGEDQALEIWDAQKDEFGRAKSSMTLQKGRLGIGTTEPEGRLAVLDEPPRVVEEFPPRAMTGYETYMEGHGVFRTSTGSRYDTADSYPAWTAFDKTVSPHGSDAWISAAGSYDNSTDLPTGIDTFLGIPGSWLKLSTPNKYTVKYITLLPRVQRLDNVSAPGRGKIYGSNDDKTWTILTEYNGLTYSKQSRMATIHVNSEKAFKYFVILVEQLNSGASPGASYSYTSIGELRYFGTREQGQSVLHDGQLTLTKSLTVPRIGPALDADDTPRRDRLVVEYNTSTNPTFEGAVRDTSGRGLDGIMHTATYNATGKAIESNGNSGTFNNGPAGTTSTASHNDYGSFETVLPPLQGNPAYTVSGWFKQNTIANLQIPWLIAKNVRVTESPGSGQSAKMSWFGVESNGRPKIAIGGGGNLELLYTSGSIQPGKWHHMIIAVQPSGTSTVAGDVKFYLDGVSQSTSSTSGSSGDIDLGGGAPPRMHWFWQESSTVYYDGSASNIKLYDIALTTEEAKTLYDMGRCDEGHHVVNFSKTRVGIGLGDGEAPRVALDVRDVASFKGDVSIGGSYSHGLRPSAPLHIAGTVQNGENSTPTSNQGINSRFKPSTRIWMANNLSETHHKGDYWGCAMGVFYDGRTYFQSLNKSSTAMYEILLNPAGGNARVGGGLISTSDDRIKTNEEYIENATETLLKLKPQTYDKQPDMNTKDGWKMKESGLIAQDVWYDTPELRHLVSYDKNAKIQLEKPIVDGDPQNDPDYSLWGEVAGLNYEGFIAYLVKSNQEIYNELQNTKIQLATSLASQNITPFQGDSIKLWITNENGSLQVGDSVMTSNISGYFTKGEPTFANVSSACEFTTSRIQTYYSNIVSVTESNVITTSETPQEGYTENAYYSSNTISYYTGNVVSHYSNVMIYDGVNVYTNVNVGEYANLTANSQSNYLAITESNTSSIEIEGYTPVLSYSNISSDEYDSNLHTDYIKVISHYSTVAVIENVEYSNIDVATYSNLETNVLITPRYTYFSNVITSEESNVVSHSNIRVQEYATLTPTKRSNYTVHTVDEVRSNLQTHYTPYTITIPNELRYLDGSGTLTDQANATYIATQVNCVL